MLHPADGGTKVVAPDELACTFRQPGLLMSLDVGALNTDDHDSWVWCLGGSRRQQQIEKGEFGHGQRGREAAHGEGRQSRDQQDTGNARLKAACQEPAWQLLESRSTGISMAPQVPGALC